MNYTPGPWTAVGSAIEADSTRPGFTDVVAWVSNDVDELDADANANLIAAAPDLLAAAKTALATAESWMHDQLDGTGTLYDALAELQPVRDAIAKAEGRHPS